MCKIIYLKIVGEKERKIGNERKETGSETQRDRRCEKWKLEDLLEEGQEVGDEGQVLGEEGTGSGRGRQRKWEGKTEEVGEEEQEAGEEG